MRENFCERLTGILAVDTDGGNRVGECRGNERNARGARCQQRAVARMSEERYIARPGLRERGDAANNDRTICPGSKLATHKGGQLGNIHLHGWNGITSFCPQALELRAELPGRRLAV